MMSVHGITDASLAVNGDAMLASPGFTMGTCSHALLSDTRSFYPQIMHRLTQEQRLAATEATICTNEFLPACKIQLIRLNRSAPCPRQAPCCPSSWPSSACARPPAFRPPASSPASARPPLASWVARSSPPARSPALRAAPPPCSHTHSLLAGHRHLQTDISMRVRERR